MKSFGLGAHALSGAVAIALLAGCGGRVGSASAIPSADLRQSFTHSRTFKFTGAKQSFKVPAGVTSITVVMRGAGGVSCPRTGRGARVYAVIPVTPGERLRVYVGGAASGSTGGFNGGGSGGSSYDGGGGGASDVRVRPGGLRDRILVAAGGGGWGLTYNGCNYGVDYGAGGGGGGLTGQNGQYGFSYAQGGSGQGGFGGTQIEGGAGGNGGNGQYCYKPGSPGANGVLGLGGKGGVDGTYSGTHYYGYSGGGGGGGYFGGGGGGGACYLYGIAGGGGGGGGSSYAEPSATKVQYWPNWKNASGDGQVVFSW